MKLEQIFEWEDDGEDLRISQEEGMESLIEEILHDMGINWRDLTVDQLTDEFLEQVIALGKEKDPIVHWDIDEVDRILHGFIGAEYK